MNNQQLKIELQQAINPYLADETADHQPVLESALTTYQNARIDGLCHEGAWEIALQVIQTYRSKNPTIAG